MAWAVMVSESLAQPDRLNSSFRLSVGSTSESGIGRISKSAIEVIVPMLMELPAIRTSF